MRFEWKVALRFLKEGKGQTIFILLGISVGVGVMVFLNTLISGLQVDLIDGTVGTSPHVWITGDNNFVEKNTNLIDWENIEEILLKRDDLTGISPVAEGNGFAIEGGESTSVLLRGVTLEKADDIYNISGSLISGNSDLGGNGIIIGKDLSDENEIAIDDVINIEVPNGNNQAFVVSGIFDLGNKAINGSWIFMDIDRAQKLLGLRDEISKIEIQINEVFNAEIIANSINERFDDIKVDNWIESNASLLTALQSQSSSSIMIQAFVLLAVTLGIASVLAVSVVQKSKQLGILKAMGTRSSSASRIFLFQGCLLGIVGSFLGSVLGIALVKGFLWGTSISTGVPLFPLQIEYRSIFVIGLIAAIASTLAAFIPAQKSSKLNPVEVIRNG